MDGGDLSELADTRASETSRYLPLVAASSAVRARTGAPAVVGVLAGEGIGPEVIDAALRVLTAVEAASPHSFELRWGGPIGGAAERGGRGALPHEVARFCEEVFADGGAILAGPAGGRFVYELRRRFDLFCKLSPVAPFSELRDAGRLRPAATAGVDLIVVRENVGGIYHGEWSEARSPRGGRRVEQRWAHDEEVVRDLLSAAARIARARRGQLAVVVKQGGLPPLAELWRECALGVAAESRVACALLDVDFAAYRLIQEAQAFDVVAAPNLFGDVLSDVAGVLLGSRALTHGASFSASGAAVYQTNHGAAWDLTGSDRANPAGEILALAMMLRESFALENEARRVVDALRAVWRAGFRTPDLAAPGANVVGTRAMTDLVTEAVAAQAGAPR